MEVYISEHSAFPLVNVWVEQQRAWKQHPCNSNARITFILFESQMILFLIYSLFPIYSLFLAYSLFPMA